MKPPLNWPALIVLAVVLVLGGVGIFAVCVAVPATSHDIVLTIVSGLVGALSMKAADNAIRSTVQTPPALPSVSGADEVSRRPSPDAPPVAEPKPGA